MSTAPLPPRISPETCQALLAYGSATVFEAQGRRGAFASGIKPVDEAMTVAGTAFTCECPPNDNLTLHAALKMAKPGDVLVCDAHGCTEQGMFGDVMSSCAVGAKLAGLVTDGGVRDSATICEVGFPVFAGGICIKGTIKETLGSLNEPIVLGGVLVRPGDVIIGDADGLVVVPFETVDAVLAACKLRAEKEAAAKQRFASGETPWDVYKLGELLTRKGQASPV
ncbi:MULTISPECIES: 4-carboxy-4-hydroxy-2-oxoadipate aldolase/oxaloacetate decarboxylase [unclassified Bosea (in: a-proteobacteria)]|jgi:4-hydroxy-4-methyl-2-oxoglutarate aldolase|uniref:4-carboxy-4-hydroxy-2-oxoadipate aldolase/oxaloacetate decarboxylase n=1 Tax=Bosea sp. (in: a-proteobacteria) TaxID=1871050 RepID=UPI001AD2139D|nr:4-carboxy-4-hydroxy-2-oxoadipate aldolase/oxaloacetate decarboxylase [Bosea sp. (in: a-proteobacteria)]MBN9467937.1 4-carboxy-4-hydroxy-2-oxoadipate aldolase/oxaloacetate decarboxylase [Bosea sp. (in: a-proteobacteria)]